MSSITATEADTIVSNLRYWLDGYREQNGAYHLHAPFYSDYGVYQHIQDGYFAAKDYAAILSEAQAYLNQVVVRQSGGTNYVTLPSVVGNRYRFTWFVDEGSFGYPSGGTGTGYGGLTVAVPNQSFGMWIGLLVPVQHNPNAYIGVAGTAFRNVNGTLDFSRPYAFSSGQLLLRFSS